MGASAVIAVAMAAASHVNGAVVDLTTNISGTANNALFQRADFRPAGSGVINSFVRVSAANQAVVQGYNTDLRPLAFDENSSPTFTRTIQFGSVPTVNVGGVDYKEFILDINQQSSDPLLSLDKIKIWTKAGSLGTNSNSVGSDGTAPTTSGASSGTGFGTLRYNLDAGTDNYVKLDYNLNSGSGQGDMFLLVPLSNFGAAAAADFVTLYSLFGQNNANNDGYEEWAIRESTPVVPLPPAALAGFAGLAVVGITRKLRR
jgi:hypothetical protein